LVARSASPHQPVVDWLAAPQTRTPLALGCFGGFAGCDAAGLYQSSLDCALPLALNWQLPMGRFRTRLTMPLRPQVTCDGTTHVLTPHTARHIKTEENCPVGTAGHLAQVAVRVDGAGGDLGAGRVALVLGDELVQEELRRRGVSRRRRDHPTAVMA
jgi:hypothetical protein